MAGPVPRNRGREDRAPATGRLCHRKVSVRSIVVRLYNLANDALGVALGSLGVRCGGATLRRAEDGSIRVYEDVGGPVGRFIKAINGGRDAAMAVGHVVLYTRRFDLATAGHRWLWAHERAHVRQAEYLGPLYLPLYLLGLLPSSLWALWRREARLFHDGHVMEQLANRSADRAVPEVAARRRGGHG